MHTCTNTQHAVHTHKVAHRIRRTCTLTNTHTHHIHTHTMLLRTAGGGAEGFQAHTCPYCGVLGFSATDLMAHVDSCGDQGSAEFVQVGGVGWAGKGDWVVEVGE